MNYNFYTNKSNYKNSPKIDWKREMSRYLTTTKLTIMFVVLVILIFVGDILSVFAQHSPQIDAREFYPLTIGNWWYYEPDSQPHEPYILKITDTTHIEGQKYYKFETTGGYFFNADQYRRVDSLGNVLAYNYYDFVDTLFRFQIPICSTELNDSGCVTYVLHAGFGGTSDVDPWTAWLADSSENFRHYKFEGQYWMEFTLQRHIGIIEASIELINWDMTAAVVNGIVYGDTSVNVGLNEKPLTLLPERTHLRPNYPNPFNAITTIQFSVSTRSPVQLSVYTIQGKKIRTLIDDIKSAGIYHVLWDGYTADQQLLSSGVYLVRLTVGRRNFVQKITFLK